MPIEITDASNVRAKLRTLGCNEPTALAVLPVNLDTTQSVEELLLGGEASTITQLLRTAQLPLTDILPGQRLPFRLRKSFDWDGGILFVGVSANIATIVASIAVIKSYLSEQYPKGGNQPRVHLEVRVETNETGSCKSIQFDGSDEAFEELPRVIREIVDGRGTV